MYVASYVTRYSISNFVKVTQHDVYLPKLSHPHNLVVLKQRILSELYWDGILSALNV